MTSFLIVMEIKSNAFVPETKLSDAPEILDAILSDALKDGGLIWCTISKIPDRKQLQ